MEVAWRGSALSQPSAMALLTMALLTMARLTMPHLLWATTVPAQLVCLVEVAEPEVVAYPRDSPIDLRIISARVAIASLLGRAGLGSGSGSGSGLGLGSGSGLGSGLGHSAPKGRDRDTVRHGVRVKAEDEGQDEGEGRGQPGVRGQDSPPTSLVTW